MGNDRLSPPVKPQPDNFDPDSALINVARAGYYGIRSAVRTYGAVIRGEENPNALDGCVWRDEEFRKAHSKVVELARQNPSLDNPAHVATQFSRVVDRALVHTPAGRNLIRVGDGLTGTVFRPMTMALMHARKAVDERLGIPRKTLVERTKPNNEYTVTVSLPYRDPQVLQLSSSDLGGLISVGMQVRIDNARHTASIQPTPEQAQILASYVAIRSSVADQISVLDHTIELKIADKHSKIPDIKRFSVMELQEYAEQGMIYNYKEKKFKKFE